jgi:hypothetical protein
VTPVFKVRLEDVLDRKHLPPLGTSAFGPPFRLFIIVGRLEGLRGMATVH